MLDYRGLTDREAYEAELIRRASRFSVCRSLGRGKYFTEFVSTLETARELAPHVYNWGGDRRGIMIYAITPDDRSALVETYPSVASWTAKARQERDRNR